MKYFTIEEWNEKMFSYPVVVSQNLMEQFYEKGFITEEQIKALREDKVVDVAGHFCITSKWIPTSTLTSEI